MKKLMAEGHAVIQVSKEELVEYLKRNPGLLGWDAVLVYDRNKTNKVLLQEYVRRFQSTSWLPPMNFDAASTPSVVERVFDYRLDAPRLSFENADVESSRADLKMRIIGGKQLTIENVNNPKQFQITRLKMADALHGPVLHVRIRLEEVNTNVSEGRVGIDLSQGTEFYLTYADTPEEDALGGLKFKQVFETLPDEKKIFVVNEVLRTSNVIKPSFIRLRTQPSPNTHLLGTPSAGDGVVMVFVGLEGTDERDTTLPTNGFQYLLPTNDASVDAAVVFKVTSVFDKLMASIMETIADTEIKFQANYEDGVLSSTAGASHRYTGDDVEVSDDRYLDTGHSVFAFGPESWLVGDFDGQLVASFEQDKLVIHWQGQSSVKSGIFSKRAFQYFETFYMDYEFSLRLSYRFDLLENGRVGLRNIESVVNLQGGAGKGYSGDWEELIVKARGFEKFDSNMRTHLHSILEQLQGLAFEFDLFLLNNLLFRGDQAFQPITIDQPGPLLTLGRLAPDLTTFEIDPVESIIGAGKQHTFKTYPAGNSVRWSVANLPGDSGDPGTINAETGVYTAPARSTLKDFHKRVIITAQARSGNASSSALVGIVTRDIGLDPLVMMVNRGVNGYKVRGTPLDPTNELTFRMSPEAQGKVIDDPDGDPDVAYSKLYVPPHVSLDAKPGPGAIAPQWREYRRSEAWRADDDLDQLLAVERVLVTGSLGGSQEVLVLLPQQNLTNWFTYETSGTGVKLTFYGSGKKGDYVVAPEDTTWYLVAGSGTFIEGLYTPAPNTEEAYAVVAAVEDDDRSWYWAIAILPVPFVTAARFVNLIQETES